MSNRRDRADERPAKEELLFRCCSVRKQGDTVVRRGKTPQPAISVSAAKPRGQCQAIGVDQDP